MNQKETLVHLAGYSTLSLILGTASWSTLGWVFALPIIFGTLGFAGLLGYRRLLEHARESFPSSPSGGLERSPATDGGQDRETDTGGSVNGRHNN